MNEWTDIIAVVTSRYINNVVNLNYCGCDTKSKLYEIEIDKVVDSLQHSGTNLEE